MSLEQGLDPGVGFAQRAQSIMDTAPGLDHQTVASLALQSTTPDQATSNAQSVAQAISQTWDGYEQTFADPVLQQQPSLQSHVVQYIHDTIGAPPIDAGTISQLQKTLQQDGLGGNLATDGAWTPDWQQQYNSAVSTLKANQLAGDKPGSVKTSSALHGFLGHLTVTGALDAIGGWVKSIPGDARNLTASTLSQLAAVPGELTSGNVKQAAQAATALIPGGTLIGTAGGGAQNATGNKVGAAIESLGRSAGPVSSQQFSQSQNLAQALDNLNTVLTFTGATGVLKKAAEDVVGAATSQALAKGAPELARGPGVIAKTLFNGNQNGRLLGSKWVGNLPGLARVTPAIGQIAGKDGYYYTARTFMAQPYRQPLVRAAGTAFSRTQLLGAGLYGPALATSPLPGNTQSQDIIGERAFDAIDHNLTNYGPKVFGWSPLDLNNLQLFLHGPFSGAGQAANAASGLTRDEFVQKFNDLSVRVAAAEKHPGVEPLPEGLTLSGSTLSPAEWSAKRGYTPAEIADFEALQKMQAGIPDSAMSKMNFDQVPYPKGSQNATAEPGSAYQQADPGAIYDYLHKAPVLSASQSVGVHTQHFVNGITDALGVKGVPAAFQQATGLSRADWLQAAGGDSNFLGQFMSSKVQGYAADWYAERQIGAPLDLANAAQKTQLAGLRDQFYADPALQTKTLADMMHSDPNQAYLTRRIGADLTRNTADPKAGLRQSLADFKTGAVLMQRIIKSGDAQYLITPQGQDVINMHALLGEGHPEGGVGSGAHLATAAPPEPGQLGLMGINGLTRNDVLDKNGIADQFATRLAASQDNVTDQQISQDMIEHLAQNHNWDARKLQLLGGSPQKLLDAIKAEAQDLAADVHPTFDQTPQAAARMKALNDAGYKVVVGSHIGHLYDGTLPPLGDNNQWLTGLRKAAGKWGLDPSKVPDVEVGRSTQQGIIDELTNDIANDSRIKLNPYQTGQTVFSMLSKDEGVQKTLPWYSRAIFAATSHIGLNKTEIEQLAQSENMTTAQATAELQQRMASGLGPRDASRKAIIQALTTTHTVQTDKGGSWEWQAIDEKSANLLFRSVVNGYRQPGYMMGWNAIENWGRAGYGIGDWAAKRLPGSSLLQNVANWPNRVAQVRNQLRFTVSPIFDLRRWTKQSLKMGLEGVEPVANPLQALIDSGDVDSAGKLLAQIGHSPINEDQINADRMLASRSVFGLYSPQWHGAYFVNQLAKQGKTPDEITAAYNRVFKYGADGGQSSLERTMNTIFFPFSFEKTLLRKTGGYLLDHPAQALALDLAVDEWRKADQNAEFGKFMMNHAPLAMELNTLNAFSHGLSPGQFGGINAPTLGAIGGDAMKAYQSNPDLRMAALNFFLPQNWGANMKPSNVQKYLPVWGQLQKVLSAADEQTKIGYAALYDTAQQAAGSTKRLPTLTAIGQQQYGTREKVKLIDQMAPVLSFNGKVADDASKIPWQAGPNVPANLVGSPINRTTIGQYVQSLYPQYDPTSGSLFAQQQQVALGKFIAGIKATDPAKGAAMAEFAKTANSVIGKINRDEYTHADQATIQGLLHQIGREGAQTDPQWSKLYSGWFAYALGPIVSPNGKAVSP